MYNKVRIRFTLSHFNRWGILLLNMSRAQTIMEKNGLDALIAATPLNLYYTTGQDSETWLGTNALRWSSLEFTKL